MSRFAPRSIRAKSMIAGLTPLLIVLALVAFIGLRTYDDVARDVVAQRDTELARVTGERIADRLLREARLLQEIAEDPRVRSLESAALSEALEGAWAALSVLNGGLIAFDPAGRPLAARPLSLEQSVPQSVADLPELLAAVQTSMRPVFSHVFQGSVPGEHLVLIGVPVPGAGDDPAGMLAGVVDLRTSLLGVDFADVLERRSGRTGLAYLVDDRGTVIYHRDVFRIGADLSGLLPVQRLIAGETGAVIGDDAAGTEVVAGYAPVPGTGWGIVTQERWDLITAPIRENGILLVALLAAGALLSTVFVSIAIGRTLRPLAHLARGADRIAGGDFDHRIEAEPDRELRTLAEQFNAMAAALRASYAGLEAKVAERTEETRRLLVQAQHRAEEIAGINARTATVADVAAKVASILGMDELLRYVTGLLRETFGYHIVYIFLVDPETNELLIRAWACGHDDAPDDGTRLQMDQGISGWVVAHAEAVLVNDVRTDRRFMSVPGHDDTQSQLSVPIASGAEVLGVLGIEEPRLDAFDETDLFTAQTLAHCLAVAIENSRLFEQSSEAAVLGERNRMAREIHDTLAQGFTGIVLQLEAAEQALEDGTPPGVLHEHLDRARRLARESLNEARRSVWNLAPRALGSQPLAGAIEEEVRRFDADGKEDVSFVVLGAARPLPAPLEAALLRICQESLTNVRRHAAAERVTVELEFTPDDVRLRIGDDGVGFDLPAAQEDARAAGGGFGISGMQQRARLFSGALTVAPNGRRGTLVEAVVPAAAESRPREVGSSRLDS